MRHVKLRENTSLFVSFSWGKGRALLENVVAEGAVCPRPVALSGAEKLNHEGTKDTKLT
jgi:hypothetical protein